MYQKVEDQLHRNFDSIAPDLFTQIKDADIHRIDSEEELFSELTDYDNKTRFYTYKRYGCIAAAILLLCVLTSFYYINTYRVTGTVLIEADNTIRLSLNKSNKIIHVEINDNEGKAEAFQDIEGLDLEEGLQNILEQKQKSSNGQSIHIQYDSQKKNESTKNIILESANKYKDLNIQADCQSYAGMNSDAHEELVDEMTAIAEIGSTEENVDFGNDMYSRTEDIQDRTEEDMILSDDIEEEIILEEKECVSISEDDSSDTIPMEIPATDCADTEDGAKEVCCKEECMIEEKESSIKMDDTDASVKISKEEVTDKTSVENEEDHVVEKDHNKIESSMEANDDMDSNSSFHN